MTSVRFSGSTQLGCRRMRGATASTTRSLWHSLSHPLNVPRQLRCELLLTLRAGDLQLFGHAPSAREWLLQEGKGSGQL